MLRRCADWLAHGCLALAWVVLLVWAVGLLVSDRYVWSQFLWWIPTPVAGAAATVMAVCGWVLGVLARLPRHPGDRPVVPRGWVRWVRSTWCAVGVVAVVFMVVEARWQRLLGPAPAPAQRPLRMVTWNINSTRIEDLPGKVRPLLPDVLLIANRPYFGSFSDLRAAVGEGTSVAAGGRLAVISKYPVIAYALVPLGVQGAEARTFRWQGGGMVSIDRGEALLVLLDTKEWNGSTLCVWLMDLPSDPPIGRARMMREARAAIEGFEGPAYKPRERAADEAVVADDALRARLLDPDVITGDFNTPRRSWSVEHVLAPGMRAAPDLVGSGWRMTFPAGAPLIAIDNTMVSARVRCYHYGVHELSARGRDHLAQLTVLEGE